MFLTLGDKPLRCLPCWFTSPFPSKQRQLFQSACVIYHCKNMCMREPPSVRLVPTTHFLALCRPLTIWTSWTNPQWKSKQFSLTAAFSGVFSNEAVLIEHLRKKQGVPYEAPRLRLSISLCVKQQIQAYSELQLDSTRYRENVSGEEGWALNQAVRVAKSYQRVSARIKVKWIQGENSNKEAS